MKQDTSDCKVFCGDCKYHWYDSTGPFDGCDNEKAGITKVITPIESYEYKESDCNIINKNNDCKVYEYKKYEGK